MTEVKLFYSLSRFDSLVFGLAAVFPDGKWGGRPNLLERGPYSKPARPGW